jgi:predicted DNA-binding protein (MmcQ/YjbR family)
MTPPEIARYCEGLPGAVPDDPFGPGLDCWMLGGKAFAMMAAGSAMLSLKDTGRHAVSVATAVTRPGKGPFLPHDGWIAVDTGTVSEDVLKRQIRDSYDLVRRELPPEEQSRLARIG